jgi:hypothetical protein
MSYRAEWKMLHVLNTCKQARLSHQELVDMGIDCVPDTIIKMCDLGLVVNNNGYYSLPPLVRAMIGNFLMARGSESMHEVYVDVPRCFVVMPFRKEFDSVFAVIEDALQQTGIECYRADKELQVGKLAANVVQSIQKAGLVIADISYENPNVYYELGIADTLGRDVLLIYDANILKNIPADKMGTLYCAYNSNDLPLFKTTLITQLQKWREDRYIDATWVHIR